MATRSHQDWAVLIQQQSASGLTISNFCRVHKLSLSGFYARKADMAKTSSQPIAPFVKATVTSSTAITTQTQPTASAQTIHFQHHTGLWTFPSTLPPRYLLEIIKRPTSMLMFRELPCVYLHRAPVDFRKSINGLAVIVEQQLSLQATDGSVFVFCNKGRDKLKILYWDNTGFALWYKRLEQDKFKWPTKSIDECLSLSEQQFHWLLSGFDVLGHQHVNGLNYS